MILPTLGMQTAITAKPSSVLAPPGMLYAGILAAKVNHSDTPGLGMPVKTAGTSTVVLWFKLFTQTR